MFVYTKHAYNISKIIKWSNNHRTHSITFTHEMIMNERINMTGRSNKILYWYITTPAERKQETQIFVSK